MAEKRLIDANAFEANIQKMFKPYGDGTYPGDYEAMIHNETLIDVMQTIEEAPTVDAVEVVHGRWWSCGIFDDLAKCSVCGVYSFTMHFVHSHNFKHCPNCGAHMDGDVNG